MDDRRRAGPGAVAALAALGLLALGGPPAAPAAPVDAAPDTAAARPAAAVCRAAAASGSEEPEARQCCFTNPAYVGVCVVQPTEKETCASILAYLNDQRSQGKSYCDSTVVRGGWQQVPCRTPSPGETSAGR
jgi:hypothetical protein